VLGCLLKTTATHFGAQTNWDTFFRFFRVLFETLWADLSFLLDPTTKNRQDRGIKKCTVPHQCCWQRRPSSSVVLAVSSYLRSHCAFLAWSTNGGVNEEEEAVVVVARKIRCDTTK